ncbi:MAG: FixH family protein [Chloroflexota bacterium]
MRIFGSHLKSPWLWLILVLVLFSLISCRRSSLSVDDATGVDLNLVVVPAEAVVGNAGLLITLHDEAGIPIDGAEVAIRGDMTHAGMIPVLAVATGMGSGQYQADIEWTMAGDWIITITATLADGQIVEREFRLPVSTE